MRKRRKKEEQSNGLKREKSVILCPKCGQRIVDAYDAGIRVFTPAAGRYPDLVIKCRHCGTEVGVIKTE